MALLPEGVTVEGVTGWYLLKLFLDRPQAQAAGGSEQRVNTITTEKQAAQLAGDVVDAQLYEMLLPVQVSLADGSDVWTAVCTSISG